MMMKKDVESVKREYDHCIIIIDEGHNLKKRHTKTTDNEEKIYDMMHEFVHTVNYDRFIILTATPIKDKSHEIASLMNLLLPLDNQMYIDNTFNNFMFDSDDNIKESSIEYFKEKCRGKIFHLRQLTSDTVVIDMGVTKPWFKNIKVWPCIMSDFQAQISDDAKNELVIQKIKVNINNKDYIQERKVKGGVVFINARDSSEFVFPDGSYGIKGFKKYVIKTGNNYTLIPEFRKSIRNGDLWIYSTKFAEVIKTIMEKPDHLNFVYFGSFVTGGGVILFGLILQEYGYKKAFNIIFTDKTPKMRRFGIITSNKWASYDNKSVRRTLDLYNDPRNKYGDYCQVLIVSKKVSEGISTRNSRIVHLVSPHFNIPSMEQPKGRNIRYGSFNDLPKHEQYCLVFKYISVIGNFDGTPSESETIDILMYKIAEEKDNKNVQIYRLMKEVAVDCLVNYDKNVLDIDIPGSREYDYKMYPLKCDAEKYAISDETTYDYYYSSDIIRSIIHKLKLYFAINFYVYISDILSHLKNVKFIYIIKSLYLIISNKIPIINRYGFICYLYETNNFYYLTGSINSIGSSDFIDNIYYLDKLLFMKVLDLDDYITIFLTDKDIPKIKQMINSINMIDIYKTLSRNTKIILMEKCYEFIHTPEYLNININQQKFVQTILEYNKYDLYIMPDKVVIHNKYSNKYTGLSYAVTTQNIVKTGAIRMYKNNKWMFVSPVEDEIYTKELKYQILSKIKTQHNHSAYATINKDDNKFRIHIKQFIKGKRRGFVCIETQKKNLIDLIISLHINIDVGDVINNMDRNTLLTNIYGISKFKEYKINIDIKSDNELKIILYMFTTSREYMCQILYDWFVKNNLIWYE